MTETSRELGDGIHLSAPELIALKPRCNALSLPMNRPAAGKERSCGAGSTAEPGITLPWPGIPRRGTAFYVCEGIFLLSSMLWHCWQNLFFWQGEKKSGAPHGLELYANPVHSCEWLSRMFPAIVTSAFGFCLIFFEKI